MAGQLGGHMKIHPFHFLLPLRQNPVDVLNDVSVIGSSGRPRTEGLTLVKEVVSVGFTLWLAYQRKGMCSAVRTRVEYLGVN